MENASIIILHIAFALMLGLQSCGSSDKSSTSPITSKDVDEKKSSCVSVSDAENEAIDIYGDAKKEAEDIYSDAMKEAEDIYNEAYEEAKKVTDDEDYQKALMRRRKVRMQQPRLPRLPKVATLTMLWMPTRMPWMQPRLLWMPTRIWGINQNTNVLTEIVLLRFKCLSAEKSADFFSNKI